MVQNQQENVSKDVVNGSWIRFCLYDLKFQQKSSINSYILKNLNSLSLLYLDKFDSPKLKLLCVNYFYRELIYFCFVINCPCFQMKSLVTKPGNINSSCQLYFIGLEKMIELFLYLDIFQINKGIQELLIF